MAMVVYCLIIHPNVVSKIYFGLNQLTDETGAQLAQLVANTISLKLLDLRANKFGCLTYSTIARSLCVNSSLVILRLCGNTAVQRYYFDHEFINALRLNPVRDLKSEWRIYTRANDFNRLKDAAEKHVAPSMLEFLLFMHLEIK